MPLPFQDGQAGTTQETAGDFSAWTGTAVDVGNTLEVVASNPHHGVNSFHAKLVAPTDSFCFYNLPNPTLTCFARAYVKYIALPPANNANLSIYFADAGAGFRSGIGVFNDSVTTNFFQTWKTNAGEFFSVVAAPLPVLGTVYCMEYEGVINAGAGRSVFYLDNVAVNTQAGLTNNILTRWLSTNCGLFAPDFPNNDEVYIDCFRANTTYNGLEASDAIIRRSLLGVGL